MISDIYQLFSDWFVTLIWIHENCLVGWGHGNKVDTTTFSLPTFRSLIGHLQGTKRNILTVKIIVYYYVKYKFIGKEKETQKAKKLYCAFPLSQWICVLEDDLIKAETLANKKWWYLLSLTWILQTIFIYQLLILNNNF